MTDPVNLNIPGLDYLFFALLFFAVVILITIVLGLIAISIRRKTRAMEQESSGAEGTRFSGEQR